MPLSIRAKKTKFRICILLKICILWPSASHKLPYMREKGEVEGGGGGLEGMARRKTMASVESGSLTGSEQGIGG
jgi:hypothetical protein